MRVCLCVLCFHLYILRWDQRAREDGAREPIGVEQARESTSLEEFFIFLVWFLCRAYQLLIDVFEKVERLGMLGVRCHGWRWVWCGFLSVDVVREVWKERLGCYAEG